MSGNPEAGYPVRNKFSPNEQEWSLLPNEHIEINYLDYDGVEVRLVVYCVSVLRSSESLFVLACLTDTDQGVDHPPLTHDMELVFKRTPEGEWRLKPTVFDMRLIGPPAKRWGWFGRFL